MPSGTAVSLPLAIATPPIFAQQLRLFQRRLCCLFLLVGAGTVSIVLLISG